MNRSLENPLVSIVIPFYSNVKWLDEAIKSVLSQTYKNVEILVINDGSPEDLISVVNKYGSSIQIFFKENGGPASARNLGIEKSMGKYIAFLDSDDLWMPDKLRVQIGYMEAKKCIWSQHSYEMFWDSSEKIRTINTEIYSGNVYQDCFISFKIQTSCVVVLKRVLEENTIRFPIEKRYGQDGGFYRQIAQDYPLSYVNGVFTRFRVRGSNAGFRAKVQINDKASTWEEIKTDKQVISILPKPVIVAYKASSMLSKLINHINKFIRSEKCIETISKAMYIFPYTIYKIYSLIRSREKNSNFNIK